MKRSCLWAVESWSVSYLKRPRRGLRFFHSDFLGPERATRARSGNSAVQKLPPVGLQKKRGGVKAVHGGRLGASSWFRYLEGMGLPVTFGCVICLDPTEEGFSMCKSLSHFGCFQELRANFVQIVQTHQSLRLERCSGTRVHCYWVLLSWPIWNIPRFLGQESSTQWVKNIPMNSPWIAMMIFGISIMGYHHLKRRLLDDSWREISHEYPRNRWPFQDPQELLAGDFPACHVWIARGYVSLKTSKNIHHFLVNPNHQEWYIYIYT